MWRAVRQERGEVREISTIHQFPDFSRQCDCHNCLTLLLIISSQEEIVCNTTELPLQKSFATRRLSLQDLTPRMTRIARTKQEIFRSVQSAPSAAVRFPENGRHRSRVYCRESLLGIRA